MEEWQICEAECLHYLRTKYTTKNFNFELEGGHNSRRSDIIVTKGGIAFFYIESKKDQAQCGQFVAFPNDATRQFDYSDSNLFPINNPTQEILENMANDFDTYKNPNTAGITLNMDVNYFYTWIKEFYRNKGVKYFIIEKEVGTHNYADDNFVIFPIENLQNYLSVEGKYRRKTSGSSNPTSKHYDEIKQIVIDKGYKNISFFNEGKYVFAKIDIYPKIYKFIGQTNTYQFKPVKDGIFSITKLSNTSNPNVIFSVRLKQDQLEADIERFKSEFY